MKNTCMALAILATCGTAMAQSSVTLYGVADAAFEHVKGSTSTTRLTSGQLQGSRWGLRGTEDLGGGLNAQFVLESGFNIDAGTSAQGGRAFGRQAFLGLGSKSVGTLRLGRQYSPMDDVANIAGTKVYDILSVVPVIGNGDYNRVDNAITYVSPNWSGLSLQAQHSLGAERPSNDASKNFQKQTSVHAMYSAGPWNLGLGLQSVADNEGAVAGDQGIDAILMAGSYTFSSGVKLTAYYDSEDRGTEKMKVYGLGAGYSFGSAAVALTVAKAQNVTGVGANGDDDATLLTLQSIYNLSKRTAFYGHYTRVSNGAQSSLGFNAPLAGQNSSGVQVGIRHRF